jgi:predicted RND superfamily exporter protein
VNNYISEDGSLTAIILETIAIVKESEETEDVLENFGQEESLNPDTSPNAYDGSHYFSEKETKEVVEAVYQVADRYKSDNFLLFYTGGPIIEDAINQIIRNDMIYLTVLTYIVMIFFLALLFRRISGVIVPIIIVFASVISTFSLMAIFNVPLTQATVILPTILSAIGIADAIHVLAIFFRHLQQGNSKEDAIAFALGHSGLAILMTSLTTSAGFFSFAFSELSTIGDLGVFTAVGVIIALFYSVVMLPAFLAVLPIKQKKTKGVLKKTKLMDRVLLAFANFSTTHPVKIVLGSLTILVIFFIFMFNLHFSLNLLKYFPDTMTIKKDSLYIDKHLKGGLAVETILDTKRENGIHEPEILMGIENISKQIQGKKIQGVFVGKVFSIVDILKETNQALHGNDPDFYKIPRDRETIAQEFLLFEGSGSDDLERIVDSQFSKTRISIKIPVYLDVVVIGKLLIDLKEIFKNEFNNRAHITITGMGELMSRTIPAAIRSMSKSYVTAVFVITIMMILLVGNVKLGLLSMIPNLIPIIMVMGFMGAAGYPLDINALMIGSIAMGLVVDDTMHFMHNFRKYYIKTGDTKIAVQETLLGAGRAMLITSVVLSTSFLVWMLGTLLTAYRFGLCAGMVILFALLADFILAPALMKLITVDKNK